MGTTPCLKRIVQTLCEGLAMISRSNGQMLRGVDNSAQERATAMICNTSG